MNNERDMHPDFGRVPSTRGIPRFVTVLAAVGLVIIFAIGGFVAFNSGYGHHFPMSKNERIDLGTNPVK